MTITFNKTRGSVPVSEKEFSQFGGHTASLHRDLLLPRPKEIPKFLILALSVLAFIPSLTFQKPVFVLFPILMFNNLKNL